MVSLYNLVCKLGNLLMEESNCQQYEMHKEFFRIIHEPSLIETRECSYSFWLTSSLLFYFFFKLILKIMAMNPTIVFTFTSFQCERFWSLANLFVFVTVRFHNCFEYKRLKKSIVLLQVPLFGATSCCIKINF